ncbi:hypothetical protein [Propionivibrio sp.]|uniref:hypothetical protein n=1 Tax=Propionivibrio sp. TaxID=2212460 RepID=UPI003BF21719
MAGADRQMGSWKEKFFHGMAEYGINVIYLALVFAAFTQYRRLLLAAHDIDYTNFGVALIEALILGKVIMLGDMFRLGRGLEQKPLIYSTLYKTVVFTFFVGVFTLVEQAIKILWAGKSLAAGFVEFLDKGPHELLAGSLVIFVALIPFFAVKELARVLGEDKIWALFFRGKIGP